MSIQFTVASFFSLLTIIIGIITAIILWSFSRHREKSNRILAIFMLSAVWILFVGLLVETKLILYVPHLYRTGKLAAFILAPLSYLYLRSVLTGRRHDATDMIHAVPFFIFLADYLSFFGRPAAEKIAMITSDLSATSQITSFDEASFAPPGFYYYALYALILLYWLLQVRAMYNLRNLDDRDRKGLTPELRTWLRNFVGVQLIGFLPLFVGVQRIETEWLVIFISLSFPVIFIAIWMFMHPGILYGLFVRKKHDENGIKTHYEYSQNSTLPEAQNAQASEFLEALHKHMNESKKFLQHKYSINHLASDMNVPPHQLSNFLNQHLQISFNDFVNKFRLEHCIERIKRGDAERLTLEALSSECGFNNRNSFTTAFKRLTGLTPSEYMRRENAASKE